MLHIARPDGTPTGDVVVGFEEALVLEVVQQLGETGWVDGRPPIIGPGSANKDISDRFWKVLIAKFDLQRTIEQLYGAKYLSVDELWNHFYSNGYCITDNGRTMRKWLVAVHGTQVRAAISEVARSLF